MIYLRSRMRTPAKLLVAGVLALVLAGCAGFGGGGGGALAPGLSARMDVAGAQLDKGQALALINSYRATNGLPPLVGDAALDGQAQTLAAQYAASGTVPKTPPGVVAMRLSAGYATFAETFSGWRNSPEDARLLANAGASKAGLAVAYNGTSGYGVHWVLLLGN